MLFICNTVLNHMSNTYPYSASHVRMDAKYVSVHMLKIHLCGSYIIRPYGKYMTHPYGRKAHVRTDLVNTSVRLQNTRPCGSHRRPYGFQYTSVRMKLIRPYGCKKDIIRMQNGFQIAAPGDPYNASV